MCVFICWLITYDVVVHFILGSNFIFPCFKLIIMYYNTQRQKKIKFEPRIKLNQTCLYWDILQANFEKKKRFVIDCTNSDKSDGFLHMRNKHMTNHKSLIKFLTSENNRVFSLSGVGFAKVNESECQQCLLVVYNCRIMTSGLKTRSQLLV